MFGNLRCPSFFPPGLARIFALPVVVATLVVGVLSTPPHVEAQTRLMFVGDSITQGGQGFASYRYPLYFDLLAAGFDVEFVGSRDFPHNNVTPNSALYPDYFTVFDRRHEGYWGWRTDQVEQVVQTAARDHRPEVVLIHLGTNDIGQNGAAGVTAAESNLEDIIQLIRFEVPTATFLLARVVPIGPGSSYSVNADQVAPLNAVVDSVAAALDTAQSPILVVDTNSGFDLGTMMQGDGIHPNELGEQFIANAWRATLSTLLPAGNPAPMVSLTSPSQGESFFAPAAISLVANATDANGSVAAVRFYADDNLLAGDTSPPFAFDWTGVAAGNYNLSAEAEDDQGAIRRSSPVSITVAAPGSEVPIAVQNAGFEQPILADGVVQNGSGIAGWTFSGTAQTFRGVFNPPAGSYPEAAGQGTPIGAEGAQVAFLFNNGGPAESVSAVQQLTETVQAGRDYTLRVAIGKFDPTQPYSPSTYGGYRIELLAGSTVIAVDTDSQNPADLTFVDAVAVVSAASIPGALVGQPLSIRLNISATAAQRSSHFDNVRLSWSAAGTNIPPEVRLTAPAAGTDFLFPATVPMIADASDSDGTVAEVRFYADGSLLATDTRAPYEYSWTTATVGSYQLTAEAEDDQGTVRVSTAVPITVSDPAAGVSIPVANPSFEQPVLADGAVQNGGGVPRWTFRGSGQTFRGVFNPPAGSYPEAAGQGTPVGADGAQVAFLFNNGGPAESVSAVQELNETLQLGRDYTLRVAVGKFDPDQPYSPSTYGGYRIELLAGDTVIAADSDTQDPRALTFVDAVAVASATNLPRSLVGQPLSIRLTISAVAAQRSTHFDNVRLTWAPSSGQIPPQVAITSPRAGSTFFTKTDVLINSEASDDDGSVAAVRVYDGDRLLTTLTRAPYSFLWRARSAGEYRLRAEAEDDQGLVTSSTVIPISVLRAGAAVPIAVGNSSFEQPALADGIVQNDVGIADWTFSGTAQTFRGVFNPPAGSYPEAAGQGTPIGAVGSQVAFLFNNGGPAEQVSAVQRLSETVQADRDYTLRVAIGKFDPTQPYATSSYGGYRIQLLAGETVIAEDSDTQNPVELTFVDATAVVQAGRIPTSLLGQPLSVRLGISSREAQRSTHFDNVRLSWSSAAGSPEPE